MPQRRNPRSTRSCREYAEGRVTTAAMRRARAPKGRDTAPLFTETIRAPGGATIYVDLKEGKHGQKFMKIKERAQGAPRYIIVPVDAIDALRRALDGALSTIRDGEYEEDADVLSDVDAQTKSPEARPDRQVTGGGGNPCTCYVGGLGRLPPARALLVGGRGRVCGAPHARI